MKSLASMLLLCSIAAAQAPKDGPARRISTIMFNPSRDTICWSMEIGKRVDGEFILEKLSDEVCIDQKESSMTVAGETVWFLKKETANMRPLFNDLIEYVVQSVLWYELRMGYDSPQERDRVEKDEKPAPKRRTIRAKR